ncbi:MAG: TonB family protein [Opitutaceae bacterium]|nr:TonB family protein [Opitutaceae bacterium]
MAAGLLAGCATDTGKVGSQRAASPIAQPAPAAPSAEQGPLVLEPILVQRTSGRVFPTGATPARIVSNPPPVYPPILRSHRIEGEARISLVVSEEGSTQDVECVEANDRRFGDAAVEAVKKWRFVPAMWQGKPVAISMQVPIVFTLDGKSSATAPLNRVVTSPPTAELTALALTGDPQRDYQTLQRLHASQPPPEYGRGSDAYFSWLQQRSRKRHDLGLEYLERYPTDARRWEIVLTLQYGRNQRVQVLRDGTKQLVPEAAERAAWDRKFYRWLEELVAARDASQRARTDALRQLIEHGAFRVFRGEPDTEPALPGKVVDWMERYERENPSSSVLASLYRTVATMLNAIEPPRGTRFLQEKRAAHAKEDVADVMLRQRLDRYLRYMTGQEQPVDELRRQLQALEPTLADASFYRGKVVLIASLAVDWGSRTMELEELYRKYHDAGLEIVQIAYYNANRSAPPEQRDKAAMQRFVAAKQWPWRVVWDPKDSPDESFAQHWGQNTIPAMFLIGRDGRIAPERIGKLTLDARIADELSRSSP